ncbi:MAG: hypothetical protein IJE50_02525 [Clostridia bacterium]|nr:hypothetical protein [Clostridia bacterium]MBQ4272536.1 hypothetical protein [Clostridia bacterium]
MKIVKQCAEHNIDSENSCTAEKIPCNALGILPLVLLIKNAVFCATKMQCFLAKTQKNAPRSRFFVFLPEEKLQKNTPTGVDVLEFANI